MNPTVHRDAARVVRFSVAVTVVILAGAPTLGAQQNVARSGRIEVRCRLDANAAWLKKQRAWLNESGAKWSDDTLRMSLVRAAGMSTTSAEPQYGWAIRGETPRAVDSTIIARLKALAATRGSTWPTRSVVGAAGTRAVWMIAHADTGLARAALKRMMEAGPDESNSADVATLEDEMRLLSGRKQIYGTQFVRSADGSIVLAPMEDSAHVDLRREDAGLPPFKLSACLARSGAGARQLPPR